MSNMIVIPILDDDLKRLSELDNTRNRVQEELSLARKAYENFRRELAIKNGLKPNDSFTLDSKGQFIVSGNHGGEWFKV